MMIILVILATWEAEIRGKVQPGQIRPYIKIKKTSDITQWYYICLAYARHWFNSQS